MEKKIGSYGWSESTDGLLSKSEKARLMTGLLRSQLHQVLGRCLKAAGFYHNRLARMDAARIPHPDSAIVREVEVEALSLYSPELWRHCQRSYAFGMLLAQFHGVRPDAERLYLGSLFHDYGLTPTHAGRSEQCGFELVGARCAHDFVARHGWEQTASRALYESISLHLNPWLSFQQNEIEAVLLQRGATLDVIGNDAHLIPGHELEQVHARHPRHGFREAIIDTMHTISHPSDSRAGFLFSCGFVRLADNNILDKAAVQRK